MSRHRFRFGSRLRRRIFSWFGMSIVTSGAIVGALAWVFSSQEYAWRDEMRGAGRFVGNRFAEAWNDSEKRDQLAREISTDFHLGVLVRDQHNHELATFGPHCGHASWSLPIRKGSSHLGTAVLCRAPGHRGPGRFMVFGMLAAVLVLWAASGQIARRLIAPLEQLVQVTRDIGNGNLESRVKLNLCGRDEVAVLASSIYEMAGKIEKQLRDQRELLAAVSHEIRTPLAHVRVLLELARTQSNPTPALMDIEREVIDMDTLVGKLLAYSRLEFGSLTKQRLDAVAAARDVLSRLELDASLVHAQSQNVIEVQADPTLLSRALANMIENAKSHGGGVTALNISVVDSQSVRFEVEDNGPGFTPENLTRAFEAFRSQQSANDSKRISLGLGLSLVQRIAGAHGGRAWAENRAHGGARVVLEIPL